jgi:hypothetical protein
MTNPAYQKESGSRLQARTASRNDDLFQFHRLPITETGAMVPWLQLRVKLCGYSAPWPLFDCCDVEKTARRAAGGICFGLCVYAKKRMDETPLELFFRRWGASYENVARVADVLMRLPEQPPTLEQAYDITCCEYLSEAEQAAFKERKIWARSTEWEAAKVAKKRAIIAARRQWDAKFLADCDAARRAGSIPDLPKVLTVAVFLWQQAFADLFDSRADLLNPPDPANANAEVVEASYAWIQAIRREAGEEVSNANRI